MQGVVPKLPLDALGFDGASLQLDLGDRRGGNLGEMLDLVRPPFARLRVDGDDDREWLTGCSGNANAEKTGNA